MGKTIAFSNQKGGVGKTTTCVNMAAYLASKGKKVLLVDLDPQGNATSGLGYAKSEIKTSVYNALIDEAPVSGIALKTSVANLDILPSNIDLAGAEVELVYMKDRERILKKMLSEVKGFYDYITIDCPPSLGLLTINALAAARELSEEAGVETEKLELLFVMYPTPGYTNEKIYIYRASGGRRTDAHPDEGEFVQAEFVPLETVKKMLEDGTINDAKTIVAAQAYFLSQREK